LTKNVYIWGTGKAAKALYEYFYENQGYKILGFLEWKERIVNSDQNKSLIQTYSIENIKLDSGTAIWIPGVYEEQITRKLTTSYKIPEENINLWLPKLIILSLNGINRSHGIGVQLEWLLNNTSYPSSQILSITCWSDDIKSKYNEIEINPVKSESLVTQKAKIKEFLGDKSAQFWSFAVEKEDFFVSRWISENFHDQLIKRRLHMYDFFPSESKVDVINILNWNDFEVSTSNNSIAELFLSMGIEIDYKPYLASSDNTREDIGFERSLAGKNGQGKPSFVVIGNLWHKTSTDECSTLVRLDELCENLPTNLIDWYCSPIRAAHQFQRVKDLGIEIKNIAYRGMAHNLGAVLQKYDIGIVYFGEQEEPETNYEKYSFPSRIMEYMSAGIPILAISPKETYLANMIVSTNIGWSFTKREFYNLPEELKNTLFSHDEIEKRRLNCLIETKRIKATEEPFLRSFRI
jgi:hypothetical protein